MIYIALAAITAAVLIAGTFASLLRSQNRQHGRREDLLINQLCNLAGNPWQQPPAKDEPIVSVPLAEDFMLSPEHEPEY